MPNFKSISCKTAVLQEGGQNLPPHVCAISNSVKMHRDQYYGYHYFCNLFTLQQLLNIKQYQSFYKLHAFNTL